MEIFHTDEGDLQHYLASDNWPALEYGEEPDQKDIGSMSKKLRGYTYKRSDCPDFSYGKGVSEEDLILLAMDHPSTLPYVEENIRVEAVRRLQEIEDRRLADYQMPTETIYLIPMGSYYLVLKGE